MAHDRSLLENIRRIQESGETGSLSLGLRDQAIRIFFREGLIEAVSSNLEEHRLGQYLVRARLVESSMLERLLKHARRKKVPIGELAVRCQLLEPVDLAQALRQQASGLFTHALEHGFAVQSFERSSRSFYMPAQIDIEYLLMEMARREPEPLGLELDQPLVLKNGNNLSHLPWCPQELSVLAELKYPQTMRQLAALTGLQLPMVQKVLNVLNSLELIDRAPQAVAGTTVEQSSISLEHLLPEIRHSVISDKLETRKNESSFVTEQFKTLKVRLSEVPTTDPLRVMTITSPEPEDGKSLISVNLAYCFSQDPGRRVILIDCDLRNSSVHKYLGISEEPGLVSYLESGQFRPYCYIRRIERLYFVTAGGARANQVELLSLGRMRGLIEYLKSEFDTVILDSPPLVPISDAQILSGMSDGLLMVVRRAKTHCSSIERALRVVDRKKIMGLVFNDVQPSPGTQFYYSRYHRDVQDRLPGYRGKIKSRQRHSQSQRQ